MTLPKYLKYVIVIFGVVLVGFILYIGKIILIPLFIAFLLSLLMLPFSNWVERKGLSRGMGASLSIVIIIVATAAMGYFLTSQVKMLMQDADRIKSSLEEFKWEAQVYIEESFGYEAREQEESVEKASEESEGLLMMLFSMASNLFIASILLPMSMFYMMHQRSYFKKFFFKLYPEEEHGTIRKLIEQEKTVTVRYISGIIGVVVILSICNVTALTLFGLEYAILFGVLAAVLNIIPLVGTIVGSLLPIIFAMVMYDSLAMPIGIAFYFWGIQILESSIITPNVVGNRVSVNPYMILIAIFVGGELWGPLGMVLFIPLLALVKVLFNLVPDLKPYGYLLTDPSAGDSGSLQSFVGKVKSKFSGK